MTFDLTTIGEGQIRLTVPAGDRLSSARELRVSPAGSEANVAGVLAQFGRSTSWCTVMPRGDLTDRCLNEYRSVGVDLSTVVRTDTGRVALYFLEPGEAPMPSRVAYDRLGTPFRDIDPSSIDWPTLLDTRTVFVTGITAALTDRTAAAVAELVERAVAARVRIVLDVNYRSLLWDADRARRVLTPLAENADLLLCSRRDAEAVFGIRGAGAGCVEALRDRFGSSHVVSTDHLSDVFAASEDGIHRYPVDVVPIVDRPGAGDAFVAGVIDGYLSGDVGTGVDHGMRIARFALTHHGDLTRIAHTDLVPATTGDIIR